jgi:hypothetical protein
VLKQVTPERLPTGKPVKVPAEMTEAELDQLVKVCVEIADYNGMDGHLVVSHFRCYHGKDWTLRILRAILHELGEPRIELHLSEPREVFVPFY